MNVGRDKEEVRRQWRGHWNSSGWDMMEACPGLENVRKPFLFHAHHLQNVGKFARHFIFLKEKD